ncbi:hypothetical protein X797_005205 [Metarhizium robertsii]|uniref:Uncharacterized protein n=1 Tax=Metarhizium robertsii TaxID=568076 RepID=A0A0A1UWH3_9HYPO|nr:hypothetical protein X797_005205 [Metarhizium robertsii]
MALLKVRFCSKLLEAGARDVCTMYNVAMVTGAELERRDRGLYPDSSLDEPESRHSRSSWPSSCQSRVTRIGQAAQAKQGRSHGSQSARDGCPINKLSTLSPGAQDTWKRNRAKTLAPWASPVGIPVNVIDETGLACFQRHGSGSLMVQRVAVMRPSSARGPCKPKSPCGGRTGRSHGVGISSGRHLIARGSPQRTGWTVRARPVSPQTTSPMGHGGCMLRLWPLLLTTILEYKSKPNLETMGSSAKKQTNSASSRLRVWWHLVDLENYGGAREKPVQALLADHRAF